MLDTSSADTFVRDVIARGGRVHTTAGNAPFVLTSDPALAEDLLQAGARKFQTGIYKLGETTHWDLTLSTVQIPTDDGDDPVHLQISNAIRRTKGGSA